VYSRKEQRLTLPFVCHRHTSRRGFIDSFGALTATPYGNAIWASQADLADLGGNAMAGSATPNLKSMSFQTVASIQSAKSLNQYNQGG